MLCLNKFFTSTSLTNSPAKSSASHTRTTGNRKTYRSPRAHDDDDTKTGPRISLPQNVTSITSTSNPFVKHCVKIRQSSSYRHFHGSVLVVGATTIREICSFHKAVSDRPIIECLFVLENCCIPEEIHAKTVHVVHVNSEVIRKVSGVQSVDSVEVIALVRIPSTFLDVGGSEHEEDFRSLFSFPHRILVLDGIQDPGNLGTLVRSATAFRWDGVLLLPGAVIHSTIKRSEPVVEPAFRFQ